MAYYTIKYFGQSGLLERMSIQADTQEQAITLSGLPSSIIDAVVIDHLGGIKAALFEKRLPLVDQAVILTAVASKLNSGKTFAKAIVESMDYTKLGITAKQVDACQTPKEYLDLFRFDETAVLLADAGDRAGNLPEALVRAATSIDDRERTRKEFGKAMSQGLFYSGLGVAFIFGIPFWAGSTIMDFIEVQKIPLQLNISSDVILALHALYTKYTVFLIGAILAIWVYRHKIWESTRRIPPISLLNERLKIKRGLEFVTTYQLLLASSYTNPQCFTFLYQRSKGRTNQLYKEAMDRLQEGRELADAFEDEDWPSILHQNLQGFEMQSPSGRDNVLSNLSNALKAYYTQYSDKVSKVALMIGFAMIVITILVFVSGFYMPLINLNAALKK